MLNLERDFFTAEDVAERAEAFAELHRLPPRERLFGPILLVIGLLAVVGLWGLRELAPTVEAASAGARGASPIQAASPVQAAIAVVEAAPARVEPALELKSPWIERRLAHAVDPSAPLRAAERDGRAGRFAQVIAALEPLGRSVERDRLLGSAYLELGRSALARDLLARAHAADPGHAETLLLLGTALQDTQDLRGARDAYQAFLEAHPDSPAAAEIQRVLSNI